MSRRRTEQELTQIITREISEEIDREIITDLRLLADTVSFYEVTEITLTVRYPTRKYIPHQLIEKIDWKENGF